MTLLPLLLAAVAHADEPTRDEPTRDEPTADAPIKVVEESLDVPAGLDPAVALAAVGDIAAIFEQYEPAIPWVPMVTIRLEKEVVSAGSPTILEMPVDGSAAGKAIVERAHVTASTRTVTCADGTEGRLVLLDFEDSSYNIERRIDRIEITACMIKGENRVHAVGRMYQGYKPEDPAFNAMMEAIGTKAIQTAFLRQVSPILDAVVVHWSRLPKSG